MIGVAGRWIALLGAGALLALLASSSEVALLAGICAVYVGASMWGVSELLGSRDEGEDE